MDRPSNSDKISRLNVVLDPAYTTCAPVQCIWEARPTEVDICRFSGQGWAGSHRWRCQSFAVGGDRPRRSAGTCHPSSAYSAPYRHPSGCYSILNRSKTHLAAEQRSRDVYDQLIQLSIRHAAEKSIHTVERLQLLKSFIRAVFSRSCLNYLVIWR